MLMSAELKGCVTWFIYFLDLLWVRYNCAKFHRCRICVTDFKERGGFLPLPLELINGKIWRTGDLHTEIKKNLKFIYKIECFLMKCICLFQTGFLKQKCNTKVCTESKCITFLKCLFSWHNPLIFRKFKRLYLNNHTFLMPAFYIIFA